MTDYPLDIIIPVWNRPVEVRAALAVFAEVSPATRLVMINNGSERETEAILHEFAEALDDRALLLSTGRNIGTVAALNLGMSRSSAPLALVTNPFVRMTSSWFDEVQSLFDRVSDAGAVCLRSEPGVTVEADHGSFAAMILKRELFLRTDGFDEQLDGALWALRDFARKATATGYKTFSLCSRQLRFEKHQLLGSTARREQLVNSARKLYVERWGEPATFMIICTDELPGESTVAFGDALLAAARQGDRVAVIAASRLVRVVIQEGLSSVHENISFHALPRFFSGRAMRKVVEALVNEDTGALLVTEDESISLSQRRLSFAGFSALVTARRERFYQGGVYG